MGGPAGAAQGPVAILAGSGNLPLLIAERLDAQGVDHRILAFRGFADAGARARADAVIGLLDVRATVAWLEACRPSAVTLAGGVRRPSTGAALEVFSAFRNRREIARLMGRGDDQLLRGVLALFEERGHTLVGVADLAPELLAREGVLGACWPTSADEVSIALGTSLLDRLSPFDIGQAAVVRGERVLAIEGPEGTDRMLKRAASAAGLLRWRRRESAGILVKGPKIGQDLRVDLPAIGPRTVVLAARAGLAGIVVESGRSLVIDEARTIAEADKRGLFLLGRPRAAVAGSTGSAGDHRVEP